MGSSNTKGHNIQLLQTSPYRLHTFQDTFHKYSISHYIPSEG